MPSYTIDIVPVPKPRMTQRDRWKQRPVVKNYHAFCDELRLLLPLPMRRPMLDQAIHELDLTFHIPMPEKSWSKKKRAELEGKPHQQKPDIDNLLKAWMDCLYRNDQVIWKVSASKLWSVKGAIEVRL